MTTPHDIEPLIAPLDGDAASGSDLEYDPDFLALEAAATPRAERAVGESVIAGEEPDWAKVETLALALFERTRDLRVAAHLCAAWASRRGQVGWADGLALVHGLLTNLWDSVHPQLDAEDDDDPTARVNAVLALTDTGGALRLFRSAPFVQSPRLGRFSLRDLRIANGELAFTGEGEAPSVAAIEACCMDCPSEQFQSAVEAVERAGQSARDIDTMLTDRLGASAPDLKPLLGDLHELQKFLRPRWEERSGSGATDEDGEAGADDGGEGGEGVERAATGRISGPADVMQRLDEVCEYYARQEPSSPVPLLLRRAQRLVGKDFRELLEDLAPGGMDELKRVSGKQPGD